MILREGMTSVVAVAGSSPAWSVVGCAFMSANRFTVACWMAALGVDGVSLWCPSSPQDHWTVPAPKTSAPLAAR